MPNHLFAALDREWQHFNCSPATSRALRKWAATEPALAPFATAGDVVAWCHHRGDPEATDRVLAALACLAPGDAAAARLLLQAMTPALKNIARSYNWLGDDEADAAVIAAAWERIRTYPATRPQRIAANIAFDVRKTLARSARRVARETGAANQLPVSSSEPTVEEQALRRLSDAVQHATVTATEASLIASTRVAGHPLRGTGQTLNQLRAERRRAEAKLEERR